MQVIIEIRMEGCAFTGTNGQELARILRNVASKINDRELKAGDYVECADSLRNLVGELNVVE